MRSWLYKDACVGSSVGLLVLRIVMGSAFILHGLPKIKNATGWMGDALPPALQACAAVAEFGGGIAILLGFLTPIAALGLAVTMAVAAGMVHIKAGHAFVDPKGPSWELAAVYFGCSIMFLMVGPGRFSVDAALFGNRATPVA